MQTLVRRILELQKVPAGRQVKERVRAFGEAGQGGAEILFGELCFCILTANYTAEGGIRVQKEIGEGFVSLGEKELAARLKALGYRFPNTRAKYIIEARKHIAGLGEVAAMDGPAAREWLVGNVKGLGYKEASHFLRNVGHREVAIIDFHIMNLLARHKLMRPPKSRSLNRKKYLEIERLLGRIGKEAGISQAELDLYLWYMETGKILK